MTSNQSQASYLIRPLPIYFLSGLVLVNFIAIFQWDPLNIGALFAFLYIMVTPGFLLLPFLAQKKLPPMLGVAFSVALSLLMLMLLGLGINTILPFFGISQPLTTVPLLVGFDGLIYILVVFNYIYKKDSPFEFHEFNAKNWTIVGLSILLPIFACLGTITLNNVGSDFLAMLTLGLAFFLMIFVMVNRQSINPSIPPITLYMMALAFLLTNSMRGWFITGHDILLEYHVFTLVNNAHLWSMSLYQDPYMACLSLTIFPTYLQNLLHVTDAYIFKFFIQFLGALPVVLVYYLTKEYVSETIAFLTGFLYISFPTFMVDMAFLNRQGMAFIFFGALLFVLLTAEYFSKRIRTLLLFLLGTGMILSHYSTAYVAMGLLILAYLINQILRLVIRTDRYRKPNLLTLTFLIGLACIMFTWFTLITKTSTSLVATIKQIGVNLEQPINLNQYSGVAKYSLVQTQQETPQQLFNQFAQQSISQDINPGNQSNFFPLSLTNSYSTVAIPEPLLPLTTLGIKLQSISHINLSNLFADLKQTYAKLLQVLLFIGLLGLIVGYSFRKNILRNVPREYVALSIAGVIILVGQTILPPTAVDYGLLRLFQQNLIFLGLPIILGLLAISNIITRNHKGQLFICSAILLFFFAVLSGFLTQFTGAARPPLPLDNSGFYYDAYYTHAQEIASIDWIAKNGQLGLSVEAAHFSDIKMIAYGHIAPRAELLPQITEKNAYVYLSFDNVKTGDILENLNGDVLYYQFPLSFLQQNKNLIYNNGGSEIYQ